MCSKLRLVHALLAEAQTESGRRTFCGRAAARGAAVLLVWRKA